MFLTRSAVLLVATLLASSQASAGTYFASDEMLVCPDIESWADATDLRTGSINGSDRCWKVPRDTAFVWSGSEQRLPTWEPAVEAIQRGRSVVVNPNLLSKQRHQDPFIVDIMVGPRGAILCPTARSLADGIAAVGVGDSDWLAEIGCVKAKAGDLARRIDPVTPKSASYWRVRYMPEGGSHRTLYGLNGDFVLRSGERILYTRW